MTDTLTVVYNDTCPICAREVAGYKRMVAHHDLPVDFAGLSSGEAARYGLTRRDAARRFHVVTPDGTLHSGVDAFALLWDHLPRLRWLADVVRLPLVAPIARLAYDYIAAPALFALHRRRERKGRAHPIA